MKQHDKAAALGSGQESRSGPEQFSAGPRKESKAGSKLLKGAAVLGLASIVSKLLGTMQKIPLQNLAGDEAYGIYNAVYPLYNVILTLAVAGFPIAVSRFVAEKAAEGNWGEARRILRLTSLWLAGTGLLCCMGLYFGADLLAGLLGNSRTALAIRSVSLALLIVPLMSALRGYFQGLEDMIPTAVSQVWEQLVRVVTMLGLLFLFLHMDDTVIAAGAMFGSVTGAAAGLGAMLYYWRREKRRRHSDRSVSARLQAGAGVQPESVKELASRFVPYALSVCLGLMAVPLLALVDSFTIPRLLGAEGWTESAALVEFGVYNRAQPLIQLVSLTATSLAVALIPAIANAKASGRADLIRRHSEAAVRFSWLIGLAAAVGLAVTAAPMNVMFYQNTLGTDAMRILALTAWLSTVCVVSGSVLQGLGREKLPAVHLLLAAAMKLALNVLLVPRYGINGAAAAAVAAYAGACLLNLIQLRRAAGSRFPAGAYIWRPLLAAALLACGLAGLLWALGEAGAVWTPPERLYAIATSLLAVAAAVPLYFAGLLVSGAWTDRDWRALPGIAGRAARLPRRLRSWLRLDAADNRRKQ
ncbi:putative polysaccharide biosynthesis protein [Paenibacillus sp. y28]|uniref:putative polysaccharide biosynthesis protein n=1 Tax=Paenibacillus sp. y28 TaxID=3129110 RepID=UPI003015A2DF